MDYTSFVLFIRFGFLVSCLQRPPNIILGNGCTVRPRRARVMPRKKQIAQSVARENFGFFQVELDNTRPSLFLTFMVKKHHPSNHSNTLLITSLHRLPAGTDLKPGGAGLKLSDQVWCKMLLNSCIIRSCSLSFKLAPDSGFWPNQFANQMRLSLRPSNERACERVD